MNLSFVSVRKNGSIYPVRSLTARQLTRERQCSTYRETRANLGQYGLCLLLFSSDHYENLGSVVTFLRAVMMDYVYRNIRVDICYKCHVIRSLDMRSFKKTATRKSTWFDILVWMNYHEVDYLLFTLFVPKKLLYKKLALGRPNC